jgi:thiamine biosynthesis protein ThiI
MKEIFLVKEGEMALKGLNRRTFENILIKNIRYALSDFEGVKVSRAQSVFYVNITGGNTETDYDAAFERLRKVFGISALCRAAVCTKDYGVIRETALRFIADNADITQTARTFKVEAKRSDKRFPMNSPEICRELGGDILEALPKLAVDVHKPDFTIHVEVREEHCYIHLGNIPGAGGLPVGSSGYALGLLSGGIDSPVALYMIAKRGVKVSAVHFEAPPYTSERAKMKVISLAGKLAPYTGGIRFFCVPFTEIQEKLRDTCMELGDDSYFTIVMRRLMIEISQRIAEREEIDALITGESIGQVASQTMGALRCTDIVCRMPVFRPLIGMDKTEIIAISEQIDTFETSTLPYEDCCTVFTPKHPKTRPEPSGCELIEKAYDFEPLLKKAIENTEIMHISAESP